MTAATVSRQFYEQMSKLSSSQLQRLAFHYAHVESRPDSAFICYTLITRRLHNNMTNKELEDVAIGWHGLWYIYFFYHYDFARAMECLREFQTMADRAGLPGSKDRPWLMKGVMYQTVADETGDTSLIKETIHCYEQALRAATKTNNYRIIVDAFSNLTLIMSDHPNMKLLTEIYQLFREHASYRRDYSYDYAVLLYENVKARAARNFSEALRMCDKLMVLGKSVTEDPRYHLSAYSVRSKTYAQAGDYRHAIADMHDLEQQAKATQYVDFLMPVYKDLQNYYQHIGNKLQASFYKQQHFELKDSLLSYHQMASVKEMTFLGEMEDMVAQVEEVEHRNFLWKLFLSISLFIAAVIATALILLRRKNLELRESNEKLYEKNVALLKTDEERRSRHSEVEQTYDLEKYKNSNLDDASKQSLQQKLRDVMDETEEYLSADFSISRLSELVDSTTKAVSQVINECFDNNFNAFINEYRIRRACQLMNGEECNNLTIEAIGNEVGFKSRSSFVIAFKRFTGLTPSNYLSMALREHSESHK